MDYEELKEKMKKIKEQSDYHTQLLLTSAELAEESCEEHAKIARTFDRLALVCYALASGLFIASCFTDLSVYPGFLVLIVGPTSITLYERERDYPYTKTIQVKLYYIDGGTEIKTFNCEGYEQPHLRPGHGYFWFQLDGHSIPSVSRYEIIKEDRFYKK